MTLRPALTAKPALAASLALVFALAACGDREVILPGPRYDPREITSPDGPAVVQPVAATAALQLPGPRANAEWTHRGGNPAHAAGHVALGAGTALQFAAPIGQPDGRRHRITADPIVAGGRIFTLDSRAGVVATALSGGRAWAADLVPLGENPNSGSGGGLAYEGGKLFVTTAYGELVALDAARGAVLWRQRLDGPAAGAPTALNGTVYVASRNATGFAVRASDGKLMWQATGIPQPTGVMGVAAPAVDGSLVVFPFSSGQLLAVARETGVQNWTAQVAGTRVGRAIAFIRDMTGEPVLLGDRVIAGTSSGRLAAFDRTTGAEIWTAREGAVSPVAAAGNAVYAINEENQLIRLDAASGGLVWARDMPLYTDQKIKKQDRIFAQYGPILAGGRLFVAGSDGVMRMFDPAAGNLVGQVAIPGGAATAPVVAGSTLYVISRTGNLLAYR